MQYIRVNKINIENKNKFDKYHYYFEDKLKEIELNRGFTLTKQVISQILESNTTNKISIIIIVTDDKLEYLIGYNIDIDFKFANVDVEKLTVNKVNYAYEKKIYGVVNPSNLNLKEVNLIDEIILENKSNDFAIKIELEKENQVQSSLEYLADLAKKIEELSSKSEININKQENVVKSATKNFFGGEGESYKKEKINEKKKLEGLKEKYEVLAVNQDKIKMPSITILYNNAETYKKIESKIVTYSKMNIGNSVFLISKDAAYLSDNKYSILDYIIPVVAFPVSDIAGMTVTSQYEYGSAILPESKSNIVLGKLNKNGKTKISINYDINDLLMHTFVTGVTGSGKTSTVKKILKEVYSAKKPFLIMEPAKSEYKYLSSIMPIRRYRLGIESEGSFRLNPFEFPNNIHIQTHLDNMKSVFIAAFPMQGPMPYILEMAFYNVYRRKGWDLISSINIYSNIVEEMFLYPTLEDLYEEIDNVTDEVGYSGELSSDVKGALKVRIGSLLSGAKGTMLNTSKSTRMEDILNYPTLIELEPIGDSQEKVFLMGLILINIYEYYVSSGSYSDELENLLIIEEAHRLLENTTATNNNEIADMKGKALESFNNILSEIRAYGQGIVIADQIPSKISPDVIKNTNLKIIHRLYANDDRELVGYSIGLEKEELKGLINLERGQSVIFHSKLLSPIKVDINIEDENLLNKSKCIDGGIPVKLEFENMISNNEIVINKISIILNSYLISNNSDYEVTKENIKNIIEKYYNSTIIKTYNFDVNSIIKYILIKYIKLLSNKKEYIITYPEQVKLIKEIHNSEYPIELFKKSISIYARDCNEKEVYNLVKNYNLIKTLYIIHKEEKNNILQLVKKYENKFKQGCKSLQEDIIEKLSLDNIFKIQILSEEEKENLVDAMIIFYFYNSEEMINLYFDIGNEYIIEESDNKHLDINDIVNNLAERYNSLKVNEANQNMQIIDELSKLNISSNYIIKAFNKNINIMMIINSIILVFIIVTIAIFK
ncbi:hypothetical protein TPELB_20060 [Terrisporobacter petrolearius]|uniref:Helicase HerA central domain-containing protein n=1 Tax=Terrisporobacter petrolearius TaxID=1460447 RepID=A0ABZ3FGD5_9FIRM